MQSKRSTEESTDRGVSPVIGVILMVAITVILAAVIAAFVLDIGPGEPEPNAVVDVNEDEDVGEVELTSLNDADAVVQVESDGSIIDDEDALTTAGQVEDLDEAAENLQAIRVSDTDDLDEYSGLDDIEDDTEANAIVDNLDEWSD